MTPLTAPPRSARFAPAHFLFANHRNRQILPALRQRSSGSVTNPLSDYAKTFARPPVGLPGVLVITGSDQSDRSDHHYGTCALWREALNLMAACSNCSKL